MSDPSRHRPPPARPRPEPQRRHARSAPAASRHAALPKANWVLRGIATGVLALAVLSAFADYRVHVAAAAPDKSIAAGPRPSGPRPTGVDDAPGAGGAADAARSTTQASAGPTPKPTASLWVIPPSPSVPPPPTLDGYTIMVDQPNTTVSGKCAAGTSVQITGAKSTVTLTGHCTSVLITADGVNLNVDQFDFGYVSGTGNVIRYGSGSPTVNDFGTGTSVAHR